MLRTKVPYKQRKKRETSAVCPAFEPDRSIAPRPSGFRPRSSADVGGNERCTQGYYGRGERARHWRGAGVATRRLSREGAGPSSHFGVGRPPTLGAGVRLGSGV